MVSDLIAWHNLATTLDREHLHTNPHTNPHSASRFPQIATAILGKELGLSYDEMTGINDLPVEILDQIIQEVHRALPPRDRAPTLEAFGTDILTHGRSPPSFRAPYQTCPARAPHSISMFFPLSTTATASSSPVVRHGRSKPKPSSTLSLLARMRYRLRRPTTTSRRLLSTARAKVSPVAPQCRGFGL
jgi:hypothetical protein